MHSLIVAPRVEVPERILADRIHRAALEGLYDTFAVYEATTVADGRVDVRSFCKHLRDTGTVVSLPPIEGRARVYPSFQFDEDLHVHELVADVNQALDARHEPIAAASWWATPNAQLDGRAPHEVVGAEGDIDLLAIANAQLDIDN